MGIVSFYRSLKYALRGLRTVLVTEKNFRIHIFIAVIVIVAGWLKNLDKISWIVLLLVMAMILALEIFNSAIERLVDILAPRTHNFAKEIKDLLAGMVLLVTFFAIAIGLIVFLL